MTVGDKVSAVPGFGWDGAEGVVEAVHERTFTLRMTKPGLNGGQRGHLYVAYNFCFSVVVSRGHLRWPRRTVVARRLPG